MQQSRRNILKYFLCFLILLNGFDLGMQITSALPDSPTSNSHVSVTEEVYRVGQVGRAVSQELIINPNETYIFTNTASASKSITNNGSSSKQMYFDYVTYRADGSIYANHMDSTSSITVQTGGHTVITVTSPNAVRVKVPQEFVYESSVTPALHRTTLYQGDNYHFENISDSSRTLLSNSSTSSLDPRIYDFAVYNADGSLQNEGFDSAVKPSVPSGGGLVVTGSSNNPVTVGFPFDQVTGDNSLEPAYHRVLLQQGESYEFTNIGTSSKYIKSDGASSDKFDYVIYDENGTEYKRNSDTSVEPSVRAGYRVVITQKTEKAVTFAAPYRVFEGKYSNEAISRISIGPNESYVFNNNGSKTNPIENDAIALKASFDYAVYRPDHTLYADGFQSNAKPMIPPLGYAIVTNSSDIPLTFDYTDDFSLESSTEPAFHRITLAMGESHTFTNISNQSKKIVSDATSTNEKRFDYVTYYPDGTERSKSTNTTTEPTVYSENTVVLTTASDNAITFGAVHRLFSSGSTPGEAITRITVQPHESYLFYNQGALSKSINHNASSMRGIIDFAVYKEDLSYDSARFNTTYSIPVPAQGTAIVTNPSQVPITFEYSNSFTSEPSAEPAFHRVTLPNGESHEFINISDRGKAIDSNALRSEGRTFEYVTYYPDGKERGKGTDTTNGPTVYSGNSVVVTTVSQNPVTFGAVYRLFESNDNPGAINKILIQPNESFIFYNKGALSLTMGHNAGSVEGFFDFASYKGETFDKEGFNTSGSVSIPASGYTIVTNPSTVGITFEYSNLITVNPSPEPALHRITLNKGKSYQFQNISDHLKSIDSNASTASNRKFDYVNYLPDGKEQHVTDTINEPNIYPGQRAIVTAVTDNAVTFGAVYRLFEVTPVDEIVHELIVKQGESFWFINNSNKEQGLMLPNAQANTKLDYIIYDREDIPLSYGYGTHSMASIPPGGKLLLTLTSEGSEVVNYIHDIKAEAAKHPAMIKVPLEWQQSYQFKNVDPNNVVNNTIFPDTDSGPIKYSFVIHNQEGHETSKGIIEHREGLKVPYLHTLTLTSLSKQPLGFVGIYTSFEGTIVKDPFEDVVVNQIKHHAYKAGTKGYLRFVADKEGMYRFAVRETDGISTQSVITIFNDSFFSEQLATTSGKKQEHGMEYVVLDLKLDEGQVVYIVLSEMEEKQLSIDFVTAEMIAKEGSTYKYGRNNRLDKVILYTGDEIILIYDKNGNMTGRSRKVFGF